MRNFTAFYKDFRFSGAQLWDTGCGNTDQLTALIFMLGKGFLLKILPYVLILALGVGGGIYTVQQKPEWFRLSKGAAAVQAETDASKVKDQPFFQKAQNGDKVLIYQKAAKAILYRPSSNMIVEVGAVNINNQAAQATPIPSASPSPTSTPKAE